MAWTHTDRHLILKHIHNNYTCFAMEITSYCKVTNKFCSLYENTFKVWEIGNIFACSHYSACLYSRLGHKLIWTFVESCSFANIYAQMPGSRYWRVMGQWVACLRGGMGQWVACLIVIELSPEFETHYLRLPMFPLAIFFNFKSYWLVLVVTWNWFKCDFTIKLK